MSSEPRERVAVVGAGIAGLASAFLLHEQGKDVVLFESEDRCGGHALTVDTKEVGPIDLGFQVCNLTTYPHLMGFLRTLGVDTEPSDMSFALSTPTVEWGSLNGFAGMFAQPGSSTSPRFLRMWYEIIRFSKNASEVLDPANEAQWADKTLRDYLKKRGYSNFFAEHYVIPMCAQSRARCLSHAAPVAAAGVEALRTRTNAHTRAHMCARALALTCTHARICICTPSPSDSRTVDTPAPERPCGRCAAIWSCSDDDALAWPVISLVRFWANHHLLSLLERPVWRVLKGRSCAYVDATVSRLPDVRVSSPVDSVVRKPAAEGGGVQVSVRGKPAERFDHVVLATHSDIARAILGSSATPGEAAALEAIAYQPNDIYLHTDESYMPRNKAAWASWNCIQKADAPAAGDKGASVCVTYWVNLLQNLPDDAPQVFVTLNPPSPPAAAKTMKKLNLAHPLLNMAVRLRAARSITLTHPYPKAVRSPTLTPRLSAHCYRRRMMSAGARRTEAPLHRRPPGRPWRVVCRGVVRLRLPRGWDPGGRRYGDATHRQTEGGTGRAVGAN